MIGTGLKKCRPPKRSGRFVAAASSVIQSEDVLDTKIVRSGTILSSAAYVCFFSDALSTTASTIRSHSFRASNVVVPARFSSVRSRASAVVFPFATPSSRNFLMRARPFSM